MWTRSYFNWRQDTSSDLQLFALLSALLVVFGGFIKSTIIRQICLVAASHNHSWRRDARHCLTFCCSASPPLVQTKQYQAM